MSSHPCYVDVHTHLTHKKFDIDRVPVIKDSIEAGLGAIVVNGLEPVSNRRIVAMAEDYPEVIAACGIYPVHAVHPHLGKDFPLQVERFDVDNELDYIEHLAKTNQIEAVGECGLDGYWLDTSTYEAQETVFKRFISIAKEYDLPIIVHSRKMEARAFEMLEDHKVEKVVFHCYGGKVKLALRYAKEHSNWCFSIPANAGVNQAFQKLLSELPATQILTETDAPYLSPERGVRNVPKNVIKTVELFGNLRKIVHEEAKNIVWTNYIRLFGSKLEPV